MNDPLRQEQAIFEEALHKSSEAERKAYLDTACQGDAALRARLDLLLRGHLQANGFLPAPNGTEPQSPSGEVAERRLPPTAAVPITEKVGDRIGHYKLLQELGEGGCGVVYMAEQEEPVRRRVALKVIKLGMDTRQVVARFEAERQALALMDHPNIAKVLDAGATKTGRPYFVMELVRGIRITDYCDQNNLGTEARLKLFIQTCQAVQHAHQKGIIHRDIKPSNILVTLHDGVPVPKVIDFGIAKATTDQRLTDKTLFTAFEQFIGTPAYMSPEQAEMSGLDIDTRSDIYSLGVLLYELLTGQTPFDPQALLRAGLDEMRRIIREEQPPRPSTRLSTLGMAEATPLTKARQTAIPVIVNELRGDLDWIVMKSLEKDRTRRYETANGLAMDVQRHLNREPVIAAAPSPYYRARKFVARNRAALLVAVSTVLLLLAGTFVSTWQAVRATQAERIAETEASRSMEVAEFLKDMLRAAGPSVARGRDATLLREVLERAARRVTDNLKGQPKVQGDLWFTLGRVFADIGDHSRAISMFEQAAASYRSAAGAENTKLALALASLGRSQSFIGNVSVGSGNATRGLEIARKCGDPETLATCLWDMGSSLSAYGWFMPGAEPFLREAVALRRKLGNDPVALASCLNGLAAALSKPGDRGDENEALAQEAVDLYRKHLEPDHPSVGGALFTLGQVLLNRNKFEEAEGCLQQAADLIGTVWDKNHPYQHHVLRYLTAAMARRGKFGEAEASLSQRLNTNSSAYWGILGTVKVAKEDWSAAAETLSRAFALAPDDESHPYNLALVLLLTGRGEEYRRHRHEYLALAETSANFHTAVRASKVSLLLPVDGTDLHRACQLADFAATESPSNQIWARLSKALAEYRRGRFDSAITWADRFISDGQECPDGSAEAWFIKALASAALNQIERAHAALARGDELVNQRSWSIEFWQDWEIAGLLRREASGLIASQPPAQRRTRPGNE